METYSTYYDGGDKHTWSSNNVTAYIFLCLKMKE